jgi:glucose-1-phosphate thymidylyltransferase
MKAVILAAGEGTRLRPLTEDKAKVLVEVDGTPLLEDVFDNLIEVGSTNSWSSWGISRSRSSNATGTRIAACRSPIHPDTNRVTRRWIVSAQHDFSRPIRVNHGDWFVSGCNAHQREQLGLAHAVLQAEPYVEADFALMLGDNVFRANLGEVVEVVEKPAEPPSNLVMTGFYTFTSAIFKACHLVQPSDRGEYELPDAIDPSIRSGRTIDAVRMDGWRVDVGYPEDRENGEELVGAGQEVSIEL